MNKMTLREQLLGATEEMRKKIKVPFQVRKDKKKMESWLIDIESEIADLEFEIKDLKSKESFDPAAILDKTDELTLKERRLKQGEALLLELFTEDTPLMEDLKQAE